MLQNTRKEAMGVGAIEDTLPKRRASGRSHLQRDDITVAAKDHKRVRVRWVFRKQGN